MTPSEALARIAALCDEHGTPRPGGCQLADEVRVVLAEVTPEPGGGWDYVTDTDGRETPIPIPEQADSVLALVRPVAGVTLTREEAARAVGWYYGQADDVVVDDADRALAARLEAAQ